MVNLNDGDYYSIKKAVLPLHPNGRRSTILESNKERHRFSHLILEHGEKHIQDWAVVASSTSNDTDSTRAPQSSLYHSNISNGGFQHSNPQFTSSKSSQPVSHSACMGLIEGRLRLCSRSIVFEPLDPCRAIIRCPFHRMEHAPRPDKESCSQNLQHQYMQQQQLQQNVRHDYFRSSPSLSTSSLHSLDNTEYDSNLSSNSPDGKSSNQQNNHGNVAIIKCTRHITMKANNIIAPFDLISKSVVFRFHFLHSSPDLFFELSHTLFQLVHSANSHTPEATSNKIDQMLKPMLIRPFDPSNFVDVREKPLTSNLRCSLLKPLLTSPGCALVTRERIYFQPANGIVSSVATKAKYWTQIDIVGYARRYNGLKDSALELFMKNQSSVLLAFDSKRDRESVIRLLPTNRVPCHTDKEFLVQAISEWVRGDLSNFEYLLALNSAAGRTYHDLSRYPVFPWVIADYKSKKLDISADSTFRDLSKPVGALDAKRLEYFMTRFQGMSEMEHPFLYGTHYSAPGYVLYYLVRNMPEHMLCLQNGKFDAPDRMFHDLEQCFSSVKSNHADVKELIPEFYDPNAGFDFLINARGLQLGITQNGERVNDVILPPWARSGRDFIRKNRKALESDKCTEMLPHWIDLIFGYKSRGEEAKKASNLFHRMAYMGPSDLKDMKTEEEKIQAELQATEFGIVPDMLFRDPHPPKGSSLIDTEFRFIHIDSKRAILEGSGETGIQDEFSFKGFENLKASSSRDQPWELLEATDSNANEKATVHSNQNTIRNNDTTPDIRVGATSTLSQKKFSEKLLPLSSQNDHDNASKNMYKIMEPVSSSGRAKASWNPKLSQGSETFVDFPNKSTGYSHIKTNGQKWGAQNGKQTSSNHEKKNSLHSSITSSSHLGSSKSFSNGKAKEQKSYVGNEFLNSGQISASLSSISGQSISNDGWDLKVLSKKMIHGDCVSSCSILVRSSIIHIVSVSLDGSMMVHKVTQGKDETNRAPQKRSFYGTKAAALVGRTRLPFRSGSYSTNESSNHEEKFELYRTHASTDPLACLDIARDKTDGHVVFAGGHNDGVVAYGINSACALASVYSHRDAVTGLNLIPRSAFGDSPAYSNGTSLPTHIMITGSWDATLKCWSVVLADDETVSINREPIAELFDADASIVCISSVEIHGTGVVISAGCADGSFVVWLFRLDGVIEVIYKQDAKKGQGSCIAIQWAPKSVDGKEYFLISGFGSGQVISSVFSNNSIFPISEISIGAPVKCFTMKDDAILVGCTDGGLRLLQINNSGCLDPHPKVWENINGVSSPAITCVCADLSIGIKSQSEGFYCISGGEDGSISLLQLKRIP